MTSELLLNASFIAGLSKYNMLEQTICQPDDECSEEKISVIFAASTEARAMLVRNGKVGFVIPGETGLFVVQIDQGMAWSWSLALCVNVHVYLPSGYPVADARWLLMKEDAILWRIQIP
jgi:hypothetical protein